MFESLAHLHDTLTLPSPHPTRYGLSEQIAELQQQLNQTRLEAAMAEVVGLPTERLLREVAWGEQCVNALLEAWDTIPGAASA